jgi:hypothetical protein
MGFKKMETNFSFADVYLFSSLEPNRAIKRMEQINAIVDWSRIESLLRQIAFNLLKGTRVIKPA